MEKEGGTAFSRPCILTKAIQMVDGHMRICLPDGDPRCGRMGGPVVFIRSDEQRNE